MSTTMCVGPLAYSAIRLLVPTFAIAHLVTFDCQATEPRMRWAITVGAAAANSR